MSDILNYDSSKSIRGYEYTRREQQRISEILKSEDFYNKDVDDIFNYLQAKVENEEKNTFSWYLKRYVFEKYMAYDPHDFDKIDNEEYKNIIKEKFTNNSAHWNFNKDKSTRLNAAILGWLGTRNVKRDAAFLVGFGLKMSAADVEVLLKKGIKEEGFNFNDPKEVIYWYCYKNDLSYKNMEDYIKWYEDALAKEDDDLYEEINKGFEPEQEDASSLTENMQLRSEKLFLRYLQTLKAKDYVSIGNQKAYDKFVELYEKCRAIALDMVNTYEYAFTDSGGSDKPLTIEERKEKEKNRWVRKALEDISSYDLEKVLCAGSLYNENSNNLIKTTFSSFNKLFDSKRMSRQRIQAILDKRQKVDRYDLLTLLFMVIGTEQPKTDAEFDNINEFIKKRMEKFVDEANEMLQECNMQGLYIVNPYECLLVMCLATESPFENRTEVIGMSYDD